MHRRNVENTILQHGIEPNLCRMIKLHDADVFGDSSTRSDGAGVFTRLGQMLTFALQHLLLTGVTDSAIAPPRAQAAMLPKHALAPDRTLRERGRPRPGAPQDEDQGIL